MYTGSDHFLGYFEGRLVIINVECLRQKRERREEREKRERRERDTSYSK